MPLLNINTLMQENLGGAPNFLSIDTEGLDLGILRLLETNHYSARGATFVNTIFVDDRHLSRPGPLTAPLRSKT
jgi:hypothetical protein